MELSFFIIIDKVDFIMHKLSGCILGRSKT
jgi:hypothetical protein